MFILISGGFILPSDALSSYIEINGLHTVNFFIFVPPIELIKLRTRSAAMLNLIARAQEFPLSCVTRPRFSMQKYAVNFPEQSRPEYVQ